MSDLFQIILDLVGALLDIGSEGSLEFLSDDTRVTRIFWCVALLVLGGVIYWEIR